MPVWEGLLVDEPATALLRDGEVEDIITEEPDSTLVSDTIQTPEPVPPVEEPGTDGEPEPAPVPQEPAVTPVNPTDIEYPINCSVPDTIQKYFRSSLYGIISNNYTSLLVNPIIESTNAFLDELSEYFTEKAGTEEEENTEYETYIGYVSQISSLKEEIKDGLFVQTILEETDEEGGTSKLSMHIQNWMLNRLEGNTELTALWKQFEERKDPFYAEVAYDTGGGLNQFYLDRTKASSGSILKTPRVAADTIATFEGKTYRGFNVVGFANPTGNKMTTVRWYAKEEATDVAYTLNMSQDDELFIQTAQGINEKWIIFYRPIASLSLSNWDNNKAFTKIVCDLETALFGETETEEDRALIAAINAAFEEEQSIADYGKTLNEVILTLSWPDLSNPEVLTITPEWQIAKGN